MKTLKKILLCSLVSRWMFAIITNANSTKFPYEDWVSWDKSSLQTDYWEMMKNNVVTEEHSLLNRILDVFNLWPDENSWRYNGVQKALYYARYLLNYALSFVAFIALCLLIYSFYCVILWDEKKIDTAKSYIKGIAIAIIVMWLSWIIVSFLFWIYEDIAQDNPLTRINTTTTITTSLQSFIPLA